jgi:putative ABC transport system substrate-binding protein
LRSNVEGNYERFPELADELARLKVDVIVSGVTTALPALKRATTTIPIVMASSIDPVGIGVVASLARPGGNITGLASTGRLCIRSCAPFPGAQPGAVG